MKSICLLIQILIGLELNHFLSDKKELPHKSLNLVPVCWIKKFFFNQAWLHTGTSFPKCKYRIFWTFSVSQMFSFNPLWNIKLFNQIVLKASPLIRHYSWFISGLKLHLFRDYFMLLLKSVLSPKRQQLQHPLNTRLERWNASQRF